MPNNNLYLNFNIILFILLFSNNSVFAQPDNKKKPKPVLSVEIGEADYIRSVKARSPKLADYRGLVMKESWSKNYYSLLNYIFFDEGKSDIPERYILIKTDSVKWFNDSMILGGTMDKYYNMLNIYAFRLIHNPNSKIKIIGCNDNKSKSEKGKLELSKARAMNVFNYLKNIWKIDERRMEISWRNLPQHPTNSENDSLSMQENRRVEIICDDWEITGPVIDIGSVNLPQPPKMNFVMNNSLDSELILNRKIEIKRGHKNWNTLTEIGNSDSKCLWNWKNIEKKYPLGEIPFKAQLVITTKSGKEYKSNRVLIPIMKKMQRTVCMGCRSRNDSVRDFLNLILFPFDKNIISLYNKEIISKILVKQIFSTSVVKIIGHAENEGDTVQCMKLSLKRAQTVSKGIKKKLGKKYRTIINYGVGVEDKLYNPEYPEGRFFNRTVQLQIKTPRTELEEY